ncbi:MAG: DUF1302 family protein [Clostridia bacterium]|nr:DUF1302 family protein [Clostridia bacterium]
MERRATSRSGAGFPMGAAIILAVCLIVAVGAAAPRACAADSTGQAVVEAKHDLTGSVEAQFHYMPADGKIDSNGLRLRLSLSGEFGPVGLGLGLGDGAGEMSIGYRLGAGADFSTTPDYKASLSIGEAYVDLHLSSTDIRAGRQVVSWGTADGINPTNVVNPSGLTGVGDMLTAADSGVPGRPVPAVSASYYFPNGAAVTGVMVLDFVPAALPAEFGPLEPVGGPENFIDQLEYAARGEMMVGGWNVYASYFSGWQDRPAAWLQFVAPEYPPVPHAAYRRMRQLGLAAAGTVGDAAVWFEGAVYLPAKLAELETAGIIPLSSNKPCWQLVTGADYTFGNGLFTSCQLIYDSAGTLINPYTKPGEAPKGALYALGVARYPLGDRGRLECIGLANITGKSAMIAPRYVVKLLGTVEASVAAMTIVGDATSDIGMLKSTVPGLAFGVKAGF